MNDSIIKTLAVAFSVCLICSLVVSSSAVSLRDLQKENKLNDRRLKVLQVADIYNPELSISEQFSQLESKFIDFDKGRIFSEYKNFNIFPFLHDSSKLSVPFTFDSKYSVGFWILGTISAKAAKWNT